MGAGLEGKRGGGGGGGGGERSERVHDVELQMQIKTKRTTVF